MNVITSNPVIINSSRVDTSDYYMAVDGLSASGTIKAFQKFANAKGWSPKLSESGIWNSQTEAASKVHGTAFDSFAIQTGMTLAGVAGKTPSSSEQEAMKKKGFDWDKATGTFKKVRESGALDWLTGLFGVQSQTPQYPDYSQGYGTPVSTGPTLAEKQPMSKGAKIALVVGGIALVGVVIYFIAKNKKKG